MICVARKPKKAIIKRVIGKNFFMGTPEMIDRIVARFKEKLNKVKAVLNENGQSLIEFVLLLLVVATISFMFVKLVNNQIAGIWVDIVKIIVDDETQNSRLDL
jgi:hypothetical protein